jgi:hypothetical protein
VSEKKELKISDLPFHRELTIETAPLVEDFTFFEIVEGGRTVGTVSARFDFSNLPDRHHALAYNWISQKRCRAHVPVEGLPVVPAQYTPSLLQRVWVALGIA